MPTYPLLGGPCNGQRSRNFLDEPATGTTLACGGAAYRYDRANPHVFVWLPTTGDGGGGTGGSLPRQRQLGAAWTALMRAYGVTVPAQLRRSAAARARMRRVVR